MVHVFVRVHMRPRMCEHLYCVRACVLEREREREGAQYINTGYFQQQSCTEDPVQRQSHQKDKMEQGHIAVWQILVSMLQQFSARQTTVSLIEFHLVQ